jgi:hypothetical protein
MISGQVLSVHGAALSPRHAPHFSMHEGHKLCTAAGTTATWRTRSRWEHELRPHGVELAFCLTDARQTIMTLTTTAPVHNDSVAAATGVLLSLLRVADASLQLQQQLLPPMVSRSPGSSSRIGPCRRAPFASAGVQ